MSKEEIILAEKEIDSDFANNKLKELDYTQAVWTLLSVVEDHYLHIATNTELSSDQYDAYVDTLLNALTYPLRICFRESKRTNNKLKKKFIEDHYKCASEWLDNAVNYGYLCCVFPLWHKGRIEITVNGKSLIPTNWVNLKLEYEAYNRLFRKDGTEENDFKSERNPYRDIHLITRTTDQDYYVNFNPKIIKDLVAYYSTLVNERYKLPEDWSFSHFSIGEFKLIYTTIQAMLFAWFKGRMISFRSNKDKYGYYPCSVLVMSKDELNNRLVRYTKLSENTIKIIMKYLQYGGMQIKNPDIALQPLVDLNNGFYALSPFVWNNTNVERNLCVLLNQITEEKPIYARLVNEKELLLRAEIELYVNKLGYELRYGKLKETNLDCAIIDRKEKACLAIELKWFIEPAEIREVLEKSEELKKGVNQAKLLKKLFINNNFHLIKHVLEIDEGYTFFSIVASKNWIGEFDVQDNDIPIMKIWPLLYKLNELKSLKSTIDWLIKREYLPTRGKDFSIELLDVKFGKWNTTWYAISPF